MTMSLEPPTGTQALLFDCDGTLVDTMHLHRIVWNQIFGRHGFEITDEWWEETGNVALLPFVRAALPDASEELAEEMNDEAIVLFNESLHLLRPLDHVIEVARAFHGRLPMAVVTGGYRDAVIPSLDAVGVTDLFDVIVTADDVVHSKPAGDVYALAAQRLGVDPAVCVAYEDSAIGMESATAAGVGRIVDVRIATRD